MSGAAETSGGWFGRLRAGLRRSSTKLGQSIGAITSGRKLDDEAVADLEEVLIAADLGVATAARLAGNLAATRFDKTVSDNEVREALATDIAGILDPVAQPLAIESAHRPHVVLVVGVNGTGKTTTIGKLAHLNRKAGRSVMLAAADTFRAAAIEQLGIWAERTGSGFVARDPGTDPAAVAFEALEAARTRNVDLLLVDTAGRLHNKAELMAQLQKVIRVLRKLNPAAPHDCVLVLDATTGQNAHAQVEAFRDLTDVTGLVVTKLDGSARGGVIVALADRFGLPIHAVGVGEGTDDLRPFDARTFARGLLGLAA